MLSTWVIMDPKINDKVPVYSSFHLDKQNICYTRQLNLAYFLLLLAWGISRYDINNLTSCINSLTPS